MKLTQFKLDNWKKFSDKHYCIFSSKKQIISKYGIYHNSLGSVDQRFRWDGKGLIWIVWFGNQGVYQTPSRSKAMRLLQALINENPKMITNRMRKKYNLISF